MIRKAFAILCLCACAGCYTQFAMIPRNEAGIEPPDSVAGGDSAQSRIQDTVRVSNNQVCYWTRDLTGQPELRCDDANYGRDWYRYNSYPWWNRTDPYFFGSYNTYGWDEQCPAYYYYDNSCGSCRYYDGYSGHSSSWWWNSPGHGSSGSSSSSSANQLRSRNGRNEGIPTATQRARGSAVPMSKYGTTSEPLTNGSGISEKTSSTTSPSVRARNSRTEGIPTSGEAQTTQDRQKAEASAVQDLNKQTESARPQQQASQPVAQPEPQTAPASQPSPSSSTTSQPPSTSGQDNSSGSSSDGGSRGGRNQRGW